MRGIGDVIRLATEPGAPVVITPPVYYPFARVVEALGRTLINAPLDAQGRLNPDTLEAACAEAAALGSGTPDQRGLILLSNPHNPTGVAHTRAELEQLAEIANRHGLRIVADEIHAPLVLSGHNFVPILQVAGAESAIVVTSASKSFNLAALKAGLIVGGPASRDDIRQWRARVSNGASHWGMLAHAAAYRTGGAWLDEVVADIARNSALLTDLVATHLPGARYQSLESTYLAWVDCRELGLGNDPAATFLEKGRVAFSSGPVFGQGGAGFVRINIATSPEILTEALTRAGSVVS
jgi:cystathionine beta-lyase